MHRTISLLHWYHKNKRKLPWRESRNPYFIWLSEVILQQTRVEQGLPYYQKFTEQFPTVKHLAQAPIDDVLKLWQGLGYYSRAKNLHETANQVVAQYQGQFPESFQQLIELKGIGDYTASAISSIAFGEKQAVVDGNVFRVLSRFYGIETPIQSNQAKKEFKQLANELLIDGEDPGQINQGLMELGSQVCTPKNPKCAECPWQNQCFAYAHQKQADYPVKQAKGVSKVVYLHYFFLKHHNQILLGKRDQQSIWKGLYQPLLVELTNSTDFPPVDELAKQLSTEPNQLSIAFASGTISHLLTHRKLMIRFYIVSAIQSLLETPASYQLYSRDEIESIPFPIAIVRFVEKHQDLLFD
jgi:A/G-specific adenine glycosylase